MKCPHCGADAVREHGPDRFGFTWISCGVCGWNKWNTTLTQEENVSVLDEKVVA